MLRHRERAFVLPLVLIVLALLSVLSMGLSQLAREKVLDVQLRKSLWHTESEAYDQLHRSLFILLAGQYREQEVVLGDQVLPIDGRWQQREGVRVSVQDVAGLYGLGLYQPRVLQHLLESFVDKNTALKVSMELKDWIDEDDETSYLGAESGDYVNLNLSQRPRNAPLRSVEELLELPSMTLELFGGEGGFEGLSRLLVAGGDSHFNLPTAPDLLIGPLLGLPSAESKALVDAKRHKDWAEVTRLVNASHPVFDGYSPFAHGSRYRLLIDAGHRVRTQVLLTPYGSSKLFKIIEWQAPDYRVQ